ncbi:MAG: methionyl-tRNA formyltransferase [Pseudomonadota bacterium]|jgi:methionyl-tRNA formyltransferase
MTLRIVFMGTPAFSVPTLAEITAAGHDVVAVYAQPPRPAGRGMAETKSPVHRFADEAGIPVLTPKSLRSEEAIAQFRAHQADVGVIVAYGLILPVPILEGTRHGCLNLHASALPRWRGAAPIQRAIMAGDTETAVMVMQMEAGLDTGPVALAEHVMIGADTTAGELHDQLSEIGGPLMVRALAALERGTLMFAPQQETGVTYARKIEKAEAHIDFTRPAAEVHNLIRGLSPFPGAWFAVTHNGKSERIKVLRSARAEDGAGTAAPGTVLDDRLTVACAGGCIRLIELQRAGKKPMTAPELLRGFALPVGTVLS